MVIPSKLKRYAEIAARTSQTNRRRAGLRAPHRAPTIDWLVRRDSSQRRSIANTDGPNRHETVS
jgi:hypothetical protein